MRLKYQIFLTLLAASALIIAIMFAFSSWSFSRGFLEYVNQNIEDSLSEEVAELEFQYEQQRNWDWVTADTVRQLRSQRNIDISRPDNSRQARNGQTSDRQRPNGRRQGRRKSDRLAPPLALANAEKQIISGQPSPNVGIQWIDLKVDNQVVGFLGFPQKNRVDRHFDQVFANKQKKNFIWTALAMVLLSALLSIPLAGLLVRPLLKLNEAVDEISGGNYSHRVSNNRRDELGDLADNINTLGLSLERNRDARRRWIAEISHELRTPVAVMRGELEAVQDGIRGMDKLAVDSLHAEALNLGRLIDDLHMLSMSDVGALNYQMAPLDLAELVREFVSGHDALLSEHELELKLQLPAEPLIVQGDAQRIEQLLANLLQNTCRYTDKNGQLGVSLTQQSVGSKPWFVLDWYDSSPGVSATVLPQLFDPLFRTDESRNRETGGSGLGLSIVKRIVDAHQGTIEASDSTLGGLRIRISLPASSAKV